MRGVGPQGRCPGVGFPDFQRCYCTTGRLPRTGTPGAGERSPVGETEIKDKIPPDTDSIHPPPLWSRRQGRLPRTPRGSRGLRALSGELQRSFRVPGCRRGGRDTSPTTREQMTVPPTSSPENATVSLPTHRWSVPGCSVGVTPTTASDSSGPGHLEHHPASHPQSQIGVRVGSS